jgi:iron complex outermembrane receptor protein
MRLIFTIIYHMHKTLTFFIGTMLLLVCFTASAQSIITLSGNVTDKATKEALPGASVTIKGKTAGTTTDVNGRFSLTSNQAPPFTIVVMYVGYKPVEQQITGSENHIEVALESGMLLGQEVVVAASRAPERILESPVSIERIGTAAVRESGAPSFYDGLSNLKGIEASTQSLTFKSINSRGFNANGNERFNQFIDGMDNQAPGLNFSVGNIVGISDLDLESAEILPGASSALYGAGGTNGTLLLNSKSPFTYPGLSFSYKVGVNHVDNSQTERSPYKDMSIRYAKAWNNKFAMKVNLSYMDAVDWQANDYSNFDRSTSTGKAGDRNSDPSYDGVNIYGDEPNANYPTPQGVAQQVQSQTRAGILAATGNTVDIVAIMNASLPAASTPAQIGAFIGSLPASLQTPVTNLVPFYFGLRNNVIPNSAVTRTGYAEKDLVDYNSKSVKTSGSLHYKITNSIEAIAQANWGNGTTVYTGLDRYSIRDFSIGQYKLELKGSNFFVRGYTTQERSGKAYNATLLGTFINEYSNPSSTWFPEYTAAYSQARLGGANDAQAAVAARAYADRNRAQPGSAEFGKWKEYVTSRTIGPAGGARFNDKTNLYHYEGMYNFTNALNNALELQVGSSYRVYNLRSDGTIFDDLNKKLNITEYGAFVQAGKKMFDDKFKLTGAVRYDKSENFEGRFTPRISGVYTVAPNNNIRVSYQTGFRNPTTQNQYIDLLVGGASGVRLIGALPEFINKYGLDANKGYTLPSLNKFKTTGNVADLVKYTFGTFKPESVKAYEIGYKGLVKNKLLFDVYYYHNSYKDFLSTLTLIQTPDGTPATLAAAKVFSTKVNNPDEVNSQGAALGLDYISGKYNLTGNVAYNHLNETSSALENEYNTPKYSFNLGVSNRQFIKNVGANLTYRWQDKFRWYSTFAAGDIPSFGTFDGQISYKIPNYQSTIKLGGSNLLNHYYRTSYGNPQIGGLYYVSLVFDQFSK